jgi:hypothetical protein
LSTLTWLFNLLQSGVASIFANGIEALHLKAEHKRIAVDLRNKELLIELVESTDTKDTSLSKRLAMAKDIAERLKSAGLTLTISYKGTLILTLGAEAKPNFSQIFTGTDAIEIHNLKQLTQLML